MLLAVVDCGRPSTRLTSFTLRPPSACSNCRMRSRTGEARLRSTAISVPGSVVSSVRSGRPESDIGASVASASHRGQCPRAAGVRGFAAVMASPAGLEPATPGFIPLRLSPPPAGRSWSGLSLRHGPRGPSGAARLVSTPSRPAPGLARDRHGARAPKRSPTLSGSTAPFPRAAPNLGNLCSILLSYGDPPVSYPDPPPLASPGRCEPGAPDA